VTLRLAFVIVATLFATQAMGDETQFVSGEPVRPAPDRAYVLVRTTEQSCAPLDCEPIVPVLVRSLHDDELDQANALARQDPDHWRDRVESNTVAPSSAAYARVGDENYFLLSIKPGTYLLSGVAVARGGMAGAFTLASLCMGTVKFDAKPGLIVDLGTIVTARDDKSTTVPELADYVTGKSLGDGLPPRAVAVRPAPPMTDEPEAVRSLPVVAADYRAVPRFPNYMGAALMRLAPLAGVLAYDKDGEVIDLKADLRP